MNSSAVLVIFVINCGPFSTHFLAHIPHKRTQSVSNRTAWVDAAGGLVIKPKNTNRDTLTPTYT